MGIIIGFGLVGENVSFFHVFAGADPHRVRPRSTRDDCVSVGSVVRFSASTRTLGHGGTRRRLGVGVQNPNWRRVFPVPGDNQTLAHDTGGFGCRDRP